MWKIISLLLLPLFICSEELEVRLATRASLKPIYLSQIHHSPTDYDWRYLEDLRDLIKFDLNQSGFCSLLPNREGLEKTLHFPDVRAHFNLTAWKKEKIPFVVTVQVIENRLQLTAFQIENGSSKRYPELALQGKIEQDRRLIHRLTDQLQKDLFGREGVASLRLLYAQRMRQGDEWHSQIWVCDADGANARPIISEKGYCLSPAFLPKKATSDAEFFYVSDQVGQTKIYRSSLSKTAGDLMVDLRGNQALPALNKNGTQMAFITDVAGRPDLFIQNFDAKGKMIGKARQLFSSARATQASPTYSPDGKQIAFVSDKDGPPRIYLVDVISKEETKRVQPRLLTRKNRENTSPSWSPDGTKLAYSAKVDGIRQIWIYDFATQEEIQLTKGPYVKENPTWAPDSFHLVYNSEGEETCELFLINLHQGEPVQITKGPGQKRFPSWEPR